MKNIANQFQIIEPTPGNRQRNLLILKIIKIMCTIQRIIEIPLEEVQSENYAANLKRYGNGSNTCIICGKGIKEGKEKMIHLLTNGNITSYEGADTENSQGFFPVGSDCAKKLIINFTF